MATENITLRDEALRRMGENISESIKNQSMVQQEKFKELTRTTSERIKNIDPERRIASQVGNAVLSAGSELTNGLLNILGPEIQTMVNVVTKTFERFQSIFGGMFSAISNMFTRRRAPRNTPQWHQQQQTPIMRNIQSDISKLPERMKEVAESTNQIQNWTDWQRKKEAREVDDEGGTTVIGALAKIMGVVVGGITVIGFGLLDYFLKPFQVTIRIMEKVYQGVRTFFGRFSLLLKIERVVAPLFRWVKTFVNITGRLASNFASLANSVRPFVGIVGKIGSRIPVIGWVLAGIMGLVDFFKAFWTTQGSLIDRIKAGLTAAVTGFFNPIFKLLGWLTDSLLGLFGIEVDSAKVMIENFKKIVSMTFDSIFSVIKSIGGMILSVGKIIVDTVTGTFGMVYSVINTIVSIFQGDFKGAFESFKNIFKTLGSTIVSIFSSVINIVQGLFDVISWPFKVFIIKPIKSLIGWFTGSPDPSAFQQAMSMLKNVVQTLFDVITWPFKTFIITPIQNIISWLGGIFNIDIFDKVIGVISSIFSIPGKIVDWIKGIIPGWNDIKQAAGELFSGDSILTKLTGILSSVFAIPGKIVDWIGNVIPGWDDIKNLIPSVGEVVGGAASKVGDAAKSAWGWISGNDEKKEKEEGGSGKWKPEKTFNVINSIYKLLSDLVPENEPATVTGSVHYLRSVPSSNVPETMEQTKQSKIRSRQEEDKWTILNEQKRMRDENRKERQEERRERQKDRQNIEQNIVSISNQSTATQSKSFEDEGPEEVGSVGLMLLNKNNF